MNTKLDVLKFIEANRFIAVVTGTNADDLLEKCEYNIASGAKILEISMSCPGATDIIQAIKRKNNDCILAGAGTVLDEVTCRIALLSGADFITTPAYDSAVARMCRRYNSVYFAGCFTAKEVKTALEEGADIIKIYPASHYGPDGIKSLIRFFEGILLMPAGGVNAKNASDYLQAGAFVVGCPFGKNEEEICQNIQAMIIAIQ